MKIVASVILIFLNVFYALNVKYKEVGIIKQNIPSANPEKEQFLKTIAFQSVEKKENISTFAVLVNYDSSTGIACSLFNYSDLKNMFVSKDEPNFNVVRILKYVLVDGDNESLYGLYLSLIKIDNNFFVLKLNTNQVLAYFIEQIINKCSEYLFEKDEIEERFLDLEGWDKLEKSYLRGFSSFDILKHYYLYFFHHNLPVKTNETSFERFFNLYKQICQNAPLSVPQNLCELQYVNMYHLARDFLFFSKIIFFLNINKAEYPTLDLCVDMNDELYVHKYLSIHLVDIEDLNLVRWELLDTNMKSLDDTNAVVFHKKYLFIPFCQILALKIHFLQIVENGITHILDVAKNVNTQN